MTQRQGSSPRVRGTSINPCIQDFFGGLIPAGAGNITKVRVLAETRVAHPRGCGEH